MKKRRLLVILLTVAFCCGLLIGLASCEPAYTNGVIVSGVTTNGVSDIELKSVDCQFNIVDYPSYYDFQGTNSYVTSTYTYYNPTVKDVIMPLYLVTDKPEYATWDFDVLGEYEFCTTAEQEIVVRCCNPHYPLTVDNFLKNVYAERQTDDYYNSDLPVYKYTFGISNLSYKVDHILFEFNKQYEDLSIIFDKGHNRNSDHISYVPDEGITEYCVYLDNTDFVTIYSIENELVGIEENIKFCKSNIVVENGGRITSANREVLNFDDLLMMYYDEESNISATDWYNAALSRVKDEYEYSDSLDVFDLTNKLSYMYQCNLVVPALTEVVQAVKMPLYPAIDWGQSEDIYIYYLDMSALSNWRGDYYVNISIIANGYYVESQSSVKLETTFYGFTIDNLNSSKQELHFALSKNPIYENNDSDDMENRFLVSLLIVGIIFEMIPLATVWIVLGIDIAKRKRAKKAAEETTVTETDIF